MEKSQIESGNRIIAIFDGWLISKSGKTFRKSNYESPYRFSDIKYHSSWDWLMPSWEKLRVDVWYSFNGSYPKGFMVYVENFKAACFNNSIGDARHAVIDGIQWFNQQKQSK